MTDLSLLHRLFRMAGVRADHPLVEMWGEADGAVVCLLRFSYREVMQAVIGKGMQFSKERRPDESLVALHLPPGPAFLVNDMALMLSGQIPVLIDHLLPPETVKGLLRSFGIKALVTSDQDLIGILAPEGRVRLLTPDFPQKEDPLPIPEELLQAALPEGEKTVAHLLLTSGTTGEPKGVALTHANLLFDADAALSYGVFTPQDRVLSVLPLHHSYPYMTGFLLPMSGGGTILFPPDLSPASLVGVMTRGEVSIFPAVPLLWERFHRRILDEFEKKPAPLRKLISRVLLPFSFMLRDRFGSRLGALPFAAVQRRFGTRMKALFSGGAALNPKIARDFFAMGLTILEGYGLTETSPVVSVNLPRNWKVGTVGPPLPGVEIRVLPPEEGRPGGRVLVRGQNVADSWWLPGGTKVPLRDEQGWFDTGDLGWFSEGRLTLVGREKEVIILPNGKNIFPEPLEQSLIKALGVAEAAVLLEGKALVALLRPDPESPISLDALTRTVEMVNREIPSHSRIASFEVVDDLLPRTRLGKLRRFMLPGIYRDLRTRRLVSSPPTSLSDSPLVARIRETIRSLSGFEGEILDAAQLEADLGIDSLGRIELLEEIEEVLGQEVPDTLLSGIVTVGDLLSRLDDAGMGALNTRDLLDRPLEESERAMIPPRGVSRGKDLSFRERLYFKGLRIGCRLLFGRGWQNMAKEPVYPRGPFVIVSNLSGPLDPLLLALSLPPEILARTVMWGVPKKDRNRVNLLRDFLGLLPVDDHQTLPGLRLAVHLLRAGFVLVAFPEGESSIDGTIGVFRPGIGKVLKQLSCPVLPVRISGSYSAWPSRRHFPRPGPVRISIGTTLSADTYRSLDEGAIGRLLEETVRTLPVA